MSSLELRLQGNKLLRSSTQPSIGRTLKKIRLELAMKYYNQAFSAADCDDDSASAAKNIAVVTAQIAEITESDSHPETLWAMLETVNNLRKALRRGAYVKSLAWLMDLTKKQNEYYHIVIAFLRDRLNAADVDRPLYKTVMYLGEIAPTRVHKANCYLTLASKYSTIGHMAAREGNYKRSLHFLAETYTPMELAKRAIAGVTESTSEGEDVHTELGILSNDIEMMICVCKSTQARKTGDNILRILLKQSSMNQVNNGLAWNAANWYTEARLLAQGVDMETEARALSQLGVLFDQIIKLKVYSTPCFKKCIILANQMRPRDVTQEDWYKVAQHTLENYQKLNQQNDIEAEEGDHRNLLKDQIDSINILNELTKAGDVNMLLGIYENFPPKKAHHKLQGRDYEKLKSNRSELKKVYRLAVLHYHPDRQGQYGDSWKALCAEISKLLTSVYEKLKDM